MYILVENIETLREPREEHDYAMHRDRIRQRVLRGFGV